MEGGRRLATWKDLCVDAVDPWVLGNFWAKVLGLEATRLHDGDLRLLGETPKQTIWVNRVPEPVTTKQRVHLDVHVGSVEDVLALGATPEDLDTFRWAVLRDPEGGELCAFVRAEVPAYRLYEIGVDATEPSSIAAWWAEVFGVAAQHDDDKPWWWLDEIPGAPFDSLVFAPVPEPKTVKNRIHWDVDAPDVQALVDHGATVLREPDDEISWTVLADPEGNEFCAFVPR